MQSLATSEEKRNSEDLTITPPVVGIPVVEEKTATAVVGTPVIEEKRARGWTGGEGFTWYEWEALLVPLKIDPEAAQEAVRHELAQSQVEDWQSKLVKLLFKAIKENNLSLVQACIAHGIPLNLHFSDKNDPVCNGQTPLTLAATLDRTEILKILLFAEAPINQPNKAGEPPIFVAAVRGCMGVIRLLIEANAQIDLKNKKVKTILLETIAHGHREAAEVLLKFIKTTLDQKKWLHFLEAREITTVLEARTIITREMVEWCLSNSLRGGTLMEKREDEGRIYYTDDEYRATSLYHAVRHGFRELAVELLASGVRVSPAYWGRLDKEKSNLLCAAALGGHVDLVPTLLEAGVDVNEADIDGTPLAIAVKKGDFSFVRKILKGTPKGIPISKKVLQAAFEDVCRTEKHWKDLQKETDIEIIKVFLQDGRILSYYDAIKKKDDHSFNPLISITQFIVKKESWNSNERIYGYLLQLFSILSNAEHREILLNYLNRYLDRVDPKIVVAVVDRQELLNKLSNLKIMFLGAGITTNVFDIIVSYLTYSKVEETYDNEHHSLLRKLNAFRRRDKEYRPNMNESLLQLEDRYLNLEGGRAELRRKLEEDFGLASTLEPTFKKAFRPFLLHSYKLLELSNSVELARNFETQWNAFSLAQKFKVGREAFLEALRYSFFSFSNIYYYSDLETILDTTLEGQLLKAYEKLNNIEELLEQFKKDCNPDSTLDVDLQRKIITSVQAIFPEIVEQAFACNAVCPEKKKVSEEKTAAPTLEILPDSPSAPSVTLLAASSMGSPLGFIANLSNRVPDGNSATAEFKGNLQG